MTKSKVRLEQLQNQIDVDNLNHLVEPSAAHQEKLIETLRIYQAELELQNQELLDVHTALSEQQQHYQDLFQLQPTANILLDRKGVIKDLNSAAAALLQTQITPKLAPSLHRFLTEASSLWLQDKLQQPALDTKEYYQTVLELKVSQYQQTFCRANLVRLPLDNRLEAFAILTLDDVTKEVVLESERTLFKAILDNSHALIFAIDLEFNLLVANLAFYKLHQLKLAPGEKPNVRTIFPEAAMRRIEQLYDTVFIRGIPVTYEFDHLLEGKTKFYQTSGFPIRNEQGVIDGAGFITTDITDKMNAEIRLQTAMQVFSEGSESVVIADKNLRITQANIRFINLIGSSADLIKGQSLLKFLHTPFTEVEERLVQQQLSQLGFWEGEVLAKHSDGHAIPLWLRLSRVPKEGVFGNYLCIISDLTESKAIEAHIEQLAYFDGLTGLANRMLLRKHLEYLLEQDENDNSTFSILYADLDHFKEVNDLHGHDLGDALLIEVAKRIMGYFRANDLVCRLGGDEFIVVLPGLPVDTAEAKANHLVKLLSEPYLIDEHRLYISASVGVVTYPIHGRDYSQLMQHADLAMYSAKLAGKATYKPFSEELIDSVKRRYAMQEQLKQAMDKQEFALAFQPIYSAAPQQEVVGVEALLRWHNPLFGQVAPDEFIPILESTGLITQVGAWIFRESCAFVHQLNQQYQLTLFCSVNISAIQLWDEHFLELFSSIIHDIGIAPNLVKLELTERVAMEKPESVVFLMKQFATLGVMFSLDDFGTGYSSLAYLKYLPIETLKIDRSFVKDIEKDQDDEIIIKALVSLAKSLGMTTTAEGVETAAQAAFLTNIGCDYLQGYFLAKPLSAAELEALIL